MTALVGVFFLLALGYAVGQAAGYSLFVERYGARNLPFAILAMPVIGAALTAAHLRLVRRVGASAAVRVEVAAMVAVSVALRVGVDRGDWVRFVLPMWDAGVNNLNNLVVWGVASHLLDVRQARRHGPLVAAGRSSALLAGGLCVPFLVDVLGTRGLYLVQGLSFLAALALLAAVVRSRRSAFATHRPTDRPPVRAPEAAEVRRYARGIFVVVLSSMVAYVLVRNVLFDRTAAVASDSADYAGRIGLVTAGQGALTLLVALVGARPFLRRCGVVGGLVALPVVLLAVYVPFAALDVSVDTQFHLAAMGFVAAGSAMFAIRTPTVQLLYQPLEPVTRARVLSTAEGLVEPSGLGIAALLLLAATRGPEWGVRGMTLSIVVVGALLLAAGLVVAGRYRRALRSALARRWFRGEGSGLGDTALQSALRDEACAGDALRALTILRMFDDAGEDPRELLHRLVDHPDEAVRGVAVGRLIELGVPLRRIQRHRAVPTGSEAVDVQLARLAGRAGGRAARTWLEDRRHAVQAGAVTGLLESPAASERTAGAELLEKWRADPDPIVRALVAGVAGQVAGQQAVIGSLLHDPEPAVRRSALRAGARAGGVAMVDELVAALDDPDAHDAAAEAVVLVGSAGVPRLVAAIGPDRPRRTHRRVVRCLGRVPGDDATSALDLLLDHGDAALRADAAVALTARSHRIGGDRQRALLAVETARAQTLLRAVQALEPTDDPLVGELLVPSLWDRVDGVRDHAVRLVGLGADAELAAHVSRAVAERDERRHAVAAEAIDNELPRDVARAVLPLLSRHRNAAQALTELGAGGTGGPVDADAALRLLASDSDRWLSRVARAVLERRLDPQGRTLMDTLLERVVFLKHVEAFAALPVELLGEIAELIDEVELDDGATLFEKGEPGSSMYVVVDGVVTIHDGGWVLDRCTRHEVFGELSLLDTEPRSASATAAGPTVLYRLDQAPFYELMTDRPEVLRGMMRRIVRGLRARSGEVAELQRRLAELEA